MTEKGKIAYFHVLRLYKAIANYIEKSGGSVVVAGGIQIQQWPTDANMNFTVAVKCLGRPPVFTQTTKTIWRKANRRKP